MDCNIKDCKQRVLFCSECEELEDITQPAKNLVIKTIADQIKTNSQSQVSYIKLCKEGLD